MMKPKRNQTRKTKKRSKSGTNLSNLEESTEKLFKKVMSKSSQRTMDMNVRGVCNKRLWKNGIGILRNGWLMRSGLNEKCDEIREDWRKRNQKRETS